MARAALLALAGSAVATPAGAAGPAGPPETCIDDAAPRAAPEPSSRRLSFGIYPGGLAGQVGASVPAEPKQESRARIASALNRLRAGRGGLTLHYYRSLRTRSQQRREERLMGRRLNFWGARGYRLDWALTYRKHDAVKEWVRFVRGIVRRHGDHPALASLQITNEVNVTVSPDASDGYFRGARRALTRGIVAAARERRRLGSRVKLGFNWFWRLAPESELEFWAWLRRNSGPPFVRSLDWIGLDAYPGSFSPAPGGSTARGVLAALRSIRCFAGFAGIARAVPLHVQEIGWGTAPGRPPEQQSEELERMIRAVDRYRGTFNVSHLNWFSLRDSDSSAPSFQQGWGLLRDDYSAKPAFASYRRLIEQLGRR